MGLKTMMGSLALEDTEESGVVEADSLYRQRLNSAPLCGFAVTLL